jgi:hypothetical protein
MRRRRVERAFFLANASSMTTRLKLLRIVILNLPAAGRAGRRSEGCLFVFALTPYFVLFSVGFVGEKYGLVRRGGRWLLNLFLLLW